MLLDRRFINVLKHAVVKNQLHGLIPALSFQEKESDLFDPFGATTPWAESSRR